MEELYLEMKLSDEEEFKHSIYLLQAVFPLLEQFNQQQLHEKQIEAKIQGAVPSGSDNNLVLKIPRDQLLFCNPFACDQNVKCVHCFTFHLFGYMCNANLLMHDTEYINDVLLVYFAFLFKFLLKVACFQT